MKPGHIRVFDGLRITTEHMDHLQGSLHSALQDIREILGLGKVFYGFQVVKEDKQTITVTPGLAFDLQKNRVACEEPGTLTVEWDPGEENEKYVCIKYKQVEDGIVEDEPTLIWDNCETGICRQFPAPEENVIAIAKLTRSENEEERFEIVSLLPGDRVEEPGGEEEDAETGISEPAEEEEPEEEEPGELPGEEVEGDLEIEIPVPAANHLKLTIMQGVEHLPLDSGNEINLGTLITGPLKKKLNSKVNSSGEELLFTLAEKEVNLDSPVCSLNCHTIINFNVSGSSSEEHLRFQSTAQGEVTIKGDRILQFGLSTVRFYSGAPGGNPWCFSDLTEQGIAHLPLDLDGFLKFPGSENIGIDTELLENLQFLVRVKEMETPGFKIICFLKWKGEITGELIRKFKEKKIIVTWKVLHAWKSLEKYDDK